MKSNLKSNSKSISQSLSESNNNINSIERQLKFHEKMFDDIKFRFREMRYPLHTWKIRHFIGVYILSRFFLRPILYYPGIACFYYIQPGRRYHNFFQALPNIVPKVMSDRFWISGSGQGYMRSPFNNQRWKEACGDFAVFLSLTWPLWLWTRFYYSYFIIEYARYRVTIIPKMKDLNSTLQWRTSKVMT